jgi:hypothetical protein
MAEMRTSFCEPPYAIAFGPWLQAFFRGGAISHEHYAATTDNVQNLVQAGVKRVFVQVRDPRAAAYSLEMMGRKFDVNMFDPNNNFVLAVRMNAEWIETWIKCRNETQVEVEFLNYSLVVGDTKAAIKRVLTPYGLAERANQIEPLLQREPPNFAIGDDDAWREQFSSRVVEQCWREIPAAVADLLSLER